MPKFIALSTEQMQKHRGPARATKEVNMYVAYLNNDIVGKGLAGGQVTLEGDDKKITEKNRIKAAAKVAGLIVKFRKTDATKIIFEVTRPSASPAAQLPPVDAAKPTQPATVPPVPADAKK